MYLWQRHLSLGTQDSRVLGYSVKLVLKASHTARDLDIVGDRGSACDLLSSLFHHEQDVLFCLYSCLSVTFQLYHFSVRLFMYFNGLCSRFYIRLCWHLYESADRYVCLGWVCM